MAEDLLAPGSTDIHKRFEGLYGILRDQLGLGPMSENLFLFGNQKRTRLKILVWDEIALWVRASRLDKGRFRRPETVSERHIARGREDLALLLNDIDLRQAERRN